MSVSASIATAAGANMPNIISRASSRVIIFLIGVCSFYVVLYYIELYDIWSNVSNEIVNFAFTYGHCEIRYNHTMKTIEFDSSIYDTIRKNIKKYRKQKNISAMQLAEMIDVSHDFIRQIESEKVERNYSVKTLYMISLALDVKIGELFEPPKE